MSLNYKNAGVDIDNANALIARIKSKVRDTHTPNVLSDIGGFAALSTLGKDYKDPVLVSGTDGVGTKLLIAKTLNKHDSIGIDLVAMCVNDVITTGATPLFFLDYLACGSLASIAYEDIITGIANGCQQSACALVGGETAELPDMYGIGEYDLAGFCVGVVEREHILDGSQVREGDSIIGVASSGLHSNGFSLARKIISVQSLNLNKRYGLSETLGEALLTPTHLYANMMRTLTETSLIRAAANITGGGLIENAIRVVPEGLALEFEKAKFFKLPLCEFLVEQGEIEIAEAYRVFNMGIGMVLISTKENEANVCETVAREGFEARVIGRVLSGKTGGRIV